MEPVPVEMSSNHVMEGSLDVDDTKQQQQPMSHMQSSESRLTITDAAPPAQSPSPGAVKPPSASRRDAVISRAELSSPVAIANGLIR